MKGTQFFKPKHFKGPEVSLLPWRKGDREKKEFVDD